MKRVPFIGIVLSLAGILFERESCALDNTRFNLPVGALVRLGKGEIGAEDGVPEYYDVSLSPDGNRIAVVSRIGIWLYDGRTGADVALLSEVPFRSPSILFSSDSGTTRLLTHRRRVRDSDVFEEDIVVDRRFKDVGSCRSGVTLLRTETESRYGIACSPRNNTVMTQPEKKEGDTIQIQLFKLDKAGGQIQGYTVELASTARLPP